MEKDQREEKAIKLLNLKGKVVDDRLCLKIEHLFWWNPEQNQSRIKDEWKQIQRIFVTILNDSRFLFYLSLSLFGDKN